jgi:hypothetical protein
MIKISRRKKGNAKDKEDKEPMIKISRRKKGNAKDKEDKEPMIKISRKRKGNVKDKEDKEPMIKISRRKKGKSDDAKDNDNKDPKKNKKKKRNEKEDEFIKLEELDQNRLAEYKTKTIIGCDPGKRSLVYMVDKDGNKIEYRAAQRRMESFTKRCGFILEIEKRRANINENDIHFNSRTVNYNNFKEYLAQKVLLNKNQSIFYG